jgi:pimeloyl-ACP methyl ester carboxylesterase
MLSDLAKHFDVHAWDMRGHGESRHAAKTQTFQGWITFYRDLVALLDASPEPMWLAGHSIGATTSLAAAMKRPNKVKGLVLVEPVLLPYSFGLILSAARLFGVADKMSMAAAAKRRKAVFASRQEAYDNYRCKRAFSSWPDEWLKAYVDHGFVEGQDESVELACPPNWESLSFMHTESNPLSWLKNSAVLNQTPIHILAAEKGSTFPGISHAKIQGKLPQARIEVLPKSSHFLPMEHPGVVMERLVGLVNAAT